MNPSDMETLNIIFREPVARFFAVECKRRDVGLGALASMAHEGSVVTVGDPEFHENPVTWALLFGWVPESLKMRSDSGWSDDDGPSCPNCDKPNDHGGYCSAVCEGMDRFPARIGD